MTRSSLHLFASSAAFIIFLSLSSMIPSATSFTSPPSFITPTSTFSSLHATSTHTPTKVHFVKYHGIGNDFILIDTRRSQSLPLTSQRSSNLCNRYYGIGGDGVIFAAPSPDKELYELEMKIFNSDGSIPEMCGNGIRCLAQFLIDNDEVKSAELPKSYRILTGAGLIVPKVNPDRTVTVDMGKPIFDPKLVPCNLPSSDEVDGGGVVEQGITLSHDGSKYKINAVSMGNPHCIIFVPTLPTTNELATIGPLLETHAVFPKKTNVEFVTRVSDTHLKMKVWERGAGPTLACGTGACALVVAAIRSGFIPRPDGNVDGGRIKVDLPGGELKIFYDEHGTGKVFMTGGAERVFDGVVDSE